MTPILILSLVLGAEPKTATAIEKKTLAEREKLERGEVTFDVTRKSFERSGELKQQRTSRYEVTFDGSNVRTIKNGYERFVFTNNYQLSHYGNDKADPKPAYKRDLTTTEGRRSYAKAYRVDPRLLGIAPTDTQGFQGRTVREVLPDPDTAKSKVTTQKLGEREVIQIVYESKQRPWTMTVIFDPKRDYSVLEALIDSVDHVDRIENKLRHYDDKYWYPETVRYTRSFNGKVISESLITVRSAVFNKPIDKEIFSFKGISLPEGTRVVESSRSRITRYWNGEKLVPRSELDPDIENN